MIANDILKLNLTFYDEYGFCVENVNEKILIVNIKTISANGNYDKKFNFI